MENKLLGYAYLENKVQEIYSNDYPDYIRNTALRNDGVELYHEDDGDEFFVYFDKQQLIKDQILFLERRIEMNNKTIETLRWNNISSKIQLDNLKTLEE